MYTKKVIDMFSTLQNYGTIKKPSGIGEWQNPSTGEVIKLYFKVEDGKITDAKFKVFGGVATAVCAETACELIVHKYLVDIKKLTANDLLCEIGTLPEGKGSCANDVSLAIKALVEDYEKREARKLKRKLAESLKFTD